MLVGTFLEGETILVVAGFLAHRGYLSLDGVMLAAFAGTCAGDQTFFWIGRRHGARWLVARPRWRARSQRALRLLEQHPVAVVLGFRFLYGIRTVTPFAIGASGFPAPRFVALNVAGAALWAVAIGGLGYGLGEGASAILHEVERYEVLVIAAIVAVGAGVWAAARLRGR